MVLKRLCLLIVLLAVLGNADCALSAVPSGDEAEAAITVDLRDTPLEDALRAIFKGAPYQYRLEVESAGRNVTLTLNNVTFSQALRAVLDMVDLTYHRDGVTYVISAKEADAGPRLPAPMPAIVFARRGESSTEVVWQQIGGAERVLYVTSNPWADMPNELGFLPSPAGRWLVVWEVRPQGGGSARLWSVVRVADGDAVELGNIAEGRLSPYWLLPYWADEGHLVLETTGESITFDTETRRLSGVLDQLRGPEPGWLANGAQKHLVSYCVRHYASEMTLLRSALARISKDLDIQGYYQEHPEPVEYLLLRALGLPTPPSPGLEGRLFQPLELTCSPDGNDVARADLWKQGPLQPLQGGYSTVEGWGARLERLRPGRCESIMVHAPGIRAAMEAGEHHDNTARVPVDVAHVWGHPMEPRWSLLLFQHIGQPVLRCWRRSQDNRSRHS